MRPQTSTHHRETRVVFGLNVVATVPVYNEADILGQVLDHLHEQGISFVVLDGGSTDGSVEITESFEGKGLLEHRVIRRDVLRLREDLDCLIKMAARHSPDWILKNDADEFLEAREAGQTLVDAITAEERYGFNVIQFDNFRFCLTEKDWNSKEPDIRKRLRFYAWVDDYAYKAWKYYPGATYRDSGGHYPTFPRWVKPRMSPRKLVMRHYPFRSPEQALRKVFKERLPRYTREERAIGWHVQYDGFKEDAGFFIRDSRLLHEYKGNCGWDTTERIDWGTNRKPPTREYLFGRWSGQRMWLRRWASALILEAMKARSLLRVGNDLQSPDEPRAEG
jgi:glycosyltransferase involved in cell wall biosynthesis